LRAILSINQQRRPAVSSSGAFHRDMCVIQWHLHCSL